MTLNEDRRYHLMFLSQNTVGWVRVGGGSTDCGNKEGRLEAKLFGKHKVRDRWVLPSASSSHRLTFF